MNASIEFKIPLKKFTPIISIKTATINNDLQLSKPNKIVQKIYLIFSKKKVDVHYYFSRKIDPHDSYQLDPILLHSIYTNRKTICVKPKHLMARARYIRILKSRNNKWRRRGENRKRVCVRLRK